jgi:hypothetical protein
MHGNFVSKAGADDVESYPITKSSTHTARVSTGEKQEDPMGYVEGCMERQV